MSQSTVSLSTVVTPAASYLLSSVADFKAQLNITETTDDAYIATLLSQASATVAQFCNQPIVAEGLLDEYWPARDPYPFQVPGGFEPLQLSRWPVVQATPDVDPAILAPVVTEDSVLLVDGVDYRVDYRRGQLIRLDAVSYPTRWRPLYISIAYTGGLTTVPADVADAVTRMMRSRWFARQRDPQLRSENISGVYEGTYWFGSGPGSSGGLPPDIVDILENYRVPVVG